MKITKFKKSDRIILMFLPAAVIVLIYVLFVHRWLQDGHSIAYGRYEKARESAADEQDLLVANTKIRFARKKQQELQQSAAVHEARLKEACGRFGEFANQTRVVESIEELAVENSIAIVAQAKIDSPAVPKETADVLRRIEERAARGLIEYRRYQLRGRYGDVVSLVRELSRLDATAVPLAVELDATKSADGIHHWELVVAM